MEDNFYKDDFEMFLKEQTDNHRMYPSDSIWRNIYKQIHGDKKWPALTVAAFILLITTVGISIHFSPKPNIFSVAPIASGVKATSKQLVAQANTSFTLSNQSSPNQNSDNWKGSIKKIEANIIQPATNQVTMSNAGNVIPLIPSIEIITSGIEENNQTLMGGGNSLQLNSSIAKSLAIEPVNASLQEINKLNTTEPSQNEVLKPIDLSPVLESNFSIKDLLTDRSKSLAINNSPKLLKPLLPAKAIKKAASWKEKFSYQVYLSASASYRKLRETSLDKNGVKEGPVALNLVADVSQVVRHKPGNGLEAGFGVMYKIAPKLKIKTGAQFNMRQYNIEAFKSTSELATITLAGSNGMDTLNSFAIYRTSTGYQEAEISNRFYQFSIPVGLDWQIAGNRDVQLNIGASVQPTYQINYNAYLLTSDFKNYTQTNNMVRKWNINSSVEANLAFKVGGYYWQVGPQVRYQHLSTMIPQYSIKEHLWDYGIKFGITKPF